MARLRIVITSEHKEGDSRFMDLELAKFSAVLERAGFPNEPKVIFEVYEPPRPGEVSAPSVDIPAQDPDPEAKAKAKK